MSFPHVRFLTGVAAQVAELASFQVAQFDTNPGEEMMLYGPKILSRQLSASGMSASNWHEFQTIATLSRQPRQAPPDSVALLVLNLKWNAKYVWPTLRESTVKARLTTTTKNRVRFGPYLDGPEKNPCVVLLSQGLGAEHRP